MSLLKEDTSARRMFGVNRKHGYRFGIFSQNSTGIAPADSNQIALETDAFSKMHNLKFLQLGHVQISGSYQNFPKELRWLVWRGFPFESIHSYFPLETLVALEMPHSRLKNFLEGTMFLELLKILNLSHSHNLAKTPDFIVLPNLERLVLEDCTRLVEIHESVGHLERLVLLNLKDCSNLRKLPRSIGMLKSLKTLEISGCSNLENLPAEMVNMDSLTVLRAENVTGISRSPATIQNVKAWYSFIWLLPLKPKRNPETSWASSLARSLVELNLEYCNLPDDAFPPDLSNLSLLRELDLSGNPIISLPDCIRGLSGLEILRVNKCRWLRSLEVLQDLEGLEFNDCSSVEKLVLRDRTLVYNSRIEKLRSHREYQTCSGEDRRLCVDGYCPLLLEISGIYKLEPLGDVDKEILDHLCLFDLGSMQNLKVTYKIPFSYPQMHSLLGCHEKHVFSTYLPGSEVPRSFYFTIKGTSFSFVPQNIFRIRAMSVCIVYAYDPEDFSLLFLLNTVISNNTKKLIWSHCPQVIGLPETRYEEDMIWLSYWKFENQVENQVEGGDEMNISVFARNFQVKEVGVHLVYDMEKAEKSTQEIPSTSEEVSEEIHRYGVALPGNASQEYSVFNASQSNKVDIYETLRCSRLIVYDIYDTPRRLRLIDPGWEKIDVDEEGFVRENC